MKVALGSVRPEYDRRLLQTKSKEVSDSEVDSSLVSKKCCAFIIALCAHISIF
jgi:hypothetical protein